MKFRTFSCNKTLEKPSLELAPTTSLGLTYLQLPIQVCLSSTLPDLAFPVSPFNFQKGTFSSRDLEL